MVTGLAEMYFGANDNKSTRNQMILEERRLTAYFQNGIKYVGLPLRKHAKRYGKLKSMSILYSPIHPLPIINQ